MLCCYITECEHSHCHPRREFHPFLLILPLTNPISVYTELYGCHFLAVEHSAAERHVGGITDFFRKHLKTHLFPVVLAQSCHHFVHHNCSFYFLTYLQLLETLMVYSFPRV